MRPTILHIFAVNGDGAPRHTNLTRAQGLWPDLPPLADWLGLHTLLTDQIEIFPVEDLGDMTLSDYVTMAFDPALPPEPEVRARIDALKGSVLIVPDTAMPADPRPGPRLTAIAALPLAEADHMAELPKADVRVSPPPPEETPEPDPKPKRRLTQTVKVLIFIVIFVALYIALDRF